MNFRQKQSARREMLGCARIARYAEANSTPEEAAHWNARAVHYLQKLNGMCGNW